MAEDRDGTGRFVHAVPRPKIAIQAGGDIERAYRLHHEAHAYCFIANSANFSITCEPTVTAV